jgi:hypothetical protein
LKKRGKSTLSPNPLIRNNKLKNLIHYPETNSRKSYHSIHVADNILVRKTNTRKERKKTSRSNNNGQAITGEISKLRQQQEKKEGRRSFRALPINTPSSGSQHAVSSPRPRTPSPLRRLLLPLPDPAPRPFPHGASFPAIPLFFFPAIDFLLSCVFLVDGSGSGRILIDVADCRDGSGSPVLVVRGFGFSCVRDGIAIVRSSLTADSRVGAGFPRQFCLWSP